MEMNKKWIKDGTLWSGEAIVLNNMRIWNPSDELLIEAGYEEYIEPVVTPTEELLLLLAKSNKILELNQYDSSDYVNSFGIKINGIVYTTWLSPELRSNYKNSLDSAEILNLTEVHPMFGTIQLTIPTLIAKTYLALIQIYADRCFIVTESHRAAIEALETVEQVNEYDYRTNYPEKLTFEL